MIVAHNARGRREFGSNVFVKAVHKTTIIPFLY
jgi:hypothetical protein